MNSSAAAQQEDIAYILHTRPYKNTSLLVEAFCKHTGRQSFVVKGAKRNNSPMQGLIEPFNSLFFVWGGRGELKNLYKAEPVPPSIKLNGEHLYAGFYVNELIMYLLHKDESHEELFLCYQACLKKLSESYDVSTILRYFELELLSELGYGVSFGHDAHTGEDVDKNKYYQYDFGLGISEYRGDDRSVLKISGATLAALEKRELANEQQKTEAKKLLRRILEFYLEGRPIKSREFFLKKNKISLLQ